MRVFTNGESERACQIRQAAVDEVGTAVIFGASTTMPLVY